jgi:hypothetical protein
VVQFLPETRTLFFSKSVRTLSMLLGRGSRSENLSSDLHLVSRLQTNRRMCSPVPQIVFSSAAECVLQCRRMCSPVPQNVLSSAVECVPQCRRLCSPVPQNVLSSAADCVLQCRRICSPVSQIVFSSAAQEHFSILKSYSAVLSRLYSIGW